MMNLPSPERLKFLAAKYLWWIPPAQAVRMPERIVAQVMNLGDYDDVQTLTEELGEDYLRHVLQHADAGVFSRKSWDFWHYRLGLAMPGEVPDLPQRRIA